MRRSRLVWGAAILALVGLVLLMPTTEDPDATRAVRRYLANIGHDVTETEDAPAGGGTLVVMADLRSPEEAQRLLDWAEAGGHLVVADPNSAIVGLSGATVAGPVGFAGTLELHPACITAVTAGVDRIVARASDAALIPGNDAFVSCFPAGDGAMLITRRHGAGGVTLLGGSSSFTNGLLREADNAGLAAQLAGPLGSVAFAGPGSAGAGTGDVWETLPERGRAAVVAIAAAGVAFALVRARRLGAPVLEEPIAPIPASELVRAAGRMYRRARATADAGRVMREASIARLSRRLRIAGEQLDVPSALARASGLPETDVAALLVGPPPSTDEELITLGRDLEALASRAERGSR